MQKQSNELLGADLGLNFVMIYKVNQKNEFF